LPSPARGAPAAALLAAAAAASGEPPTAAPPATPPGRVEPAGAPSILDQLRRDEAGLVEARVLLRTGRELVGLLVSKEGRTATLRIRGDDLPIDLADAVEFEELGPVLENFDAMRAAIADEDIPARLHLVRWLRDRGAYLAAEAEAERILRLEPFNTEAGQVRAWLSEQIRLRVNAIARDEAGLPDPHSPAQRRKIEDFPVLTPEEINLMRVYEVSFADPPRMLIPRSTVESLITLYADHELMPRTQEGREALLRRDPLTVLDLMFRVQARPLYGEVRVLEDPASLAMFREEVHRTWLVGSNASCASSACHGGEEAGRLYLNNHRTNQDATVYTNFFIIDRFRLASGAPLINYEEPAESPLLQMALPREKSRLPHPEVGRTEGRRGWRPYFRDEDDFRFKRAVDWIKSMYRPRPDYPIDYVPPVPEGVLRMEGQDEPPER
jgi:hypothetical protein